MAMFEDGKAIDAPSAEGLTMRAFEAASVGDDAMRNTMRHWRMTG